MKVEDVVSVLKLIPKRCTLLKFSMNTLITVKSHWFFLLWIEAWIFILALHKMTGEEDLSSNGTGEYVVCSHSLCKSWRLLCRSLNFQERTVLKCCLTHLFSEAAYLSFNLPSFSPSLFQMNDVFDEAVCVKCRGTGRAHSCTSGAVKLLSFLSSASYMKYKLSLKDNPPPHTLSPVALLLSSQMSWLYLRVQCHVSDKIQNQPESWGVILGSSV